MQQLEAVFEIEDVAAIGRIARFNKTPDRYGIHVSGKWFVTFVWQPRKGAADIRLERKKAKI